MFAHLYDRFALMLCAKFMCAVFRNFDFHRSNKHFQIPLII